MSHGQLPTTPRGTEGIVSALAGNLVEDSRDSWKALRTYVLRSRSEFARSTLLGAAASTPDDLYLRSQAAAALAIDPRSTNADLLRAFEYMRVSIDDRGTGRGWAAIREAWGIVAQGLLTHGLDNTVREILERVPLDPHLRWELTTDLQNPLRKDDDTPQAVTEFLASVNRLFALDNLDHVALDPPEGVDASGEPYMALRSRPTHPVVGGELVTVVMSAYKPGPEIHTAVRSIRDQSWQAWELLIVDDCSGPEYDALFEQLTGCDSRIRLLRAPSNRGTYAARNLALRHALGRYVTFQDSDDWSHPQRLERQVAPLQADPRILATRSWAVRAYPDLTFTYPGYSSRRVNASSLLMDRQQVHELVGDFDEVRVSADVELPSRLLAARPNSVIDDEAMGHLAITLLRHGSLSRADATPGWMRWTRTAYKDAFRAWHTEIRTGQVSARLLRSDPRPFPLPDSQFVADRNAPPAPAPAIVILGDLRQGHARARATAELARVLSSQHTVALAHVETPEPLAAVRLRTHHEVQRALSLGIVSHSHPSRADEIDLLVVTEPGCLIHLDEVQLRPERVLIVGDAWSTSRIWSVRAVASVVKELWEQQPTWTFASRQEAERFAREHPEELIWREPLPWAVHVDEQSATPPPSSSHYLTVGHHVSDGGDRWPPDADDFAGVVAVPSGVDVRLLEGTRELRRRYGTGCTPPGWLDLSHTGMSTREFLTQLDAFVYPGAWDSDVEVATLQAAAAGVPVISTVPDHVIPEDLRQIIHRASMSAILDTAREVSHDRALASEVVRSRSTAWLLATRELTEMLRGARTS